MADWRTLVDMRASFLCLFLVIISTPLTSTGAQMNPTISSTPAPDPVVTIRSGQVRGLRTYVPSVGREVDVFFGIPFAKPPRGRLRFRHPQPIDAWPGVLNATELPASCFQKPDTEFGDFYGSTVWNSPTPLSEDCLYVNVFVPHSSTAPTDRPRDEESTDKTIKASRRQDRCRQRGGPERRRHLAVMVWIYGGGFFSGTTTLGLYDAKVLAALGDVIVVSIAYRVGALGFLSLGHADAPGNAGLFDQLMGLDWVQQNVEAFGGDPNKITIFGESAGSVSVSLHLLSPLSHSKFNRAIMQSGTANMPWATTTQAEAKRRSLEFAFDYLHCPRTTNMAAVAACLRSMPAPLLVQEQWVSRGIMQFPFIPVVDGVFLPEPPDELLRRSGFKRCPVLMGSNHNEASFFIIYELPDQLGLERTSMNKEEYTSGMRQLFEYYPQYRPYHRLTDRALDLIKAHYPRFLDSDDTHKNLESMDMAASDSQFVCPLNHFAQRYSQAGLDVYTYFFTHRYKSNPWPEWMGVLHGDEIFFIFGDPFRYRLNYTDEDRALSRQMVTYWSNFAKTGNPNYVDLSRPRSTRGPEWPLHSPAGQEYLELNPRFLNGKFNDGKAIGRGPRAVQCGFWHEYMPDIINFTDTDPGVEMTERVILPSSPVAPEPEQPSYPTCPSPESHQSVESSSARVSDCFTLLFIWSMICHWYQGLR